jgi:hypothetical protein
VTVYFPQYLFCDVWWLDSWACNTHGCRRFEVFWYKQHGHHRQNGLCCALSPKVWGVCHGTLQQTDPPLCRDVIDAGQSNAKIAAAMAAYHTSTVCHRGSVVLHVHEEFRNLQQQALEIGRSVEGLLAQQPNTIQASSTLPPLDRACTNIDVEMEPVLKGGGQSNLHMTVNLQDLVMDSLHSAMITSVAELYTEAQSQVEEIKRIILGEVSQHSLHLSELGQDSDSMVCVYSLVDLCY